MWALDQGKRDVETPDAQRIDSKVSKFQHKEHPIIRFLAQQWDFDGSISAWLIKEKSQASCREWEKRNKQH